MVSDTWSTDVLASDSEIMEAVPGAAEPPQQSLPGPPQVKLIILHHWYLYYSTCHKKLFKFFSP